MENPPPGFEILLEDGPLLAVNKPAGLLTQAPLGIDSLEFRVKQFYRQREGKEGNVYLGVPHRLDRPVSGVIVFARHVRAARRISEQFERRQVEKVYWALAAGRVEPESGTWTDYLRKITNEPRTVVVQADHPEGRVAVLHYRVLEWLPASTWLEIRLETGRTHQIRVQTSARGHAVIGDRLYGSGTDFCPPTEDGREQFIALHARSLALEHPMRRERLEIVAPLPSHWQQAGLPAE